MSGRLGLRKKKGRKPAKIMTGNGLVHPIRGRERLEERDIVGVVFRPFLFGGQVRHDRDLGLGSREVRNESEGGDSVVELRAVELSDNIRPSWGLANNHDRADVTRLRLAIQRLLGTRVPHKHKGTRLKVEVDDTGDKDQNTHQPHAGYIGSTDNK